MSLAAGSKSVFGRRDIRVHLALLSHYRVSREKAVVHGGGKLARELVRSTQ